jgi:hypothetical protein
MRDAAIKQLTDPGFRPALSEALSSWENAHPAAIDRTLAWVMQLREELVSLIRTIDDDEQIAETLAINYIEIKTRWIALNTKINYQTFRLGACDPELAFRGTACSCLLAEVEALLTPDDVIKITEFLAQPVTRAAA